MFLAMHIYNSINWLVNRCRLRTPNSSLFGWVPVLYLTGGGEGQQMFSQKPKFVLFFFKPSLVMNKLQIIKVRIKIPSKNSSSYESYSASISCTIRVKSPAYSEPKRPCEPTKLYQQPCITCLLLTMVILIANGWACKFHCNLWSKQFLISDSFIYFTKEYLTGAFSLYELDRLAEISRPTAGLCQLGAAEGLLASLTRLLPLLATP